MIAWLRRRTLRGPVAASASWLVMAIVVIAVIQSGRHSSRVTVLDHYDVVVDNRSNLREAEIQAQDTAEVYHAFTIPAQSRASLPDGDWTTVYQVDATCAIVSAEGVRWGPDPVVTIETRRLPIDAARESFGRPSSDAHTMSPVPTQALAPILSAVPSKSCPNGPRSTTPTMPFWRGP